MMAARPTAEPLAVTVQALAAYAGEARTDKATNAAAAPVGNTECACR
jgi:hypothetical protein